MMKAIITLFLLLPLFSFALTDQDKAQLQADVINILPNPGFEARTAGWNNIGGGTLIIDESTPLDGQKSVIWDPSAASDALSSDAITIRRSMLGQKCQIVFSYNWQGVLGNIQVKVIDTGSIASELFSLNLLPTESGSSGKFAYEFDCPDDETDTLTARLEAYADAVSVKLDNYFMGSGKNIVSIADDIVYLGPITTTGSHTTNTTYTANYWRHGDMLVAEIEVLYSGAPNAGGLSVTLPSLPQFGGQLTIDSSKLPGVSTLKDVGRGVFHDPGVGRYRVLAMYNGPSVVRVDYLLESANPAVTTQNLTELAPVSIGSTDEIFIRYEVPITQFSSFAQDRAIAIDQPSLQFIRAAHGSSCDFSRTNVSYGLPAGDASCSFTVVDSAGFTSVVSVLESGNNSSGISFNSNSSGRLFICAGTSMRSSVGTSPNVTVRLRDVVGSVTLDDQEYRPSTVPSMATPVKLCAVANYVTGTNTFQLETAASSGAVNLTTAFGQNAIHWSIFDISKNLPTPEFRELTTDVSNRWASPLSNEGMIRAGVNCSGSSSATDEANVISSVTNISGGSCTVNFEPNIFSGGFIRCFLQRTSAFGSAAELTVTVANPTNMVMDCELAATGACSAIGFHMMCVGAKGTAFPNP